MKINREQFLAAAALIMAANTGCGKLANRLGVEIGSSTPPIQADPNNPAPGAPAGTAATPPITPGAPGAPISPAAPAIKAAGPTVAGVKPGALPTPAGTGTGVTTSKGFAAPANEGALGGPTREAVPPTREQGGPSREFGAPSKEARGPTREGAGGPSREARGPSKEGLPAPAREAGVRPPPPRRG